MRFIDLFGISLSTEWQQKLGTWENRISEYSNNLINNSIVNIQISGVNPRTESFNLSLKPDISKYIEKYRSNWRELKELLEQDFYAGKKCWFTESKADGFNFDIEHFRPKNAVDKTKFNQIFFKDKLVVNEANRITDKGYYWLAFNWKNYRLSCEITNTSYKQNYFPIKERTTVAENPNDDFSLEIPFLIDPTIEEDVKLITFDIDGKAKPTDDHYPDELTTLSASELWNYIRAKTSIELYGLNHYTFVNSRKKLWAECEKEIKKINENLNPIKNNLHSLTDNELILFDNFQHFINSLKEKIQITSAYSATALTCINNYEHKYEWINNYVL